jgi:DNA-binding PadR family transcriptional regulator
MGYSQQMCREVEMERELLLLGLLRSHEMHGYQLNEFIDSHLGATVHLKKPTAYRLLNKMADDGWVTYREEREGNRPPRRVFAITPQGEAAFQQLLRESLADYKPIVSLGNIGLLFLDAVPPKEALGLLQKRRASVESVLQQAHAHKVHEESFPLVLSHQIRHFTTELEWLDEVVAQLESRSQEHSPGEGHNHQGYGRGGYL